ncbi:PASTA domain-containing protein [Fulvivirga sp.]
MVIKQDPEEGHQIKIGDVVNLWIVPESDVELNEEMEE